jgi:low affinity Fe/Cu permease
MRPVLLFAMLVLLGGCREDLSAVEAKLDAPLRQKLEQLAAAKERETISLLGKCSRPIDAAARAELENAGAEIQSVTGEQFVARIRSDRVPKLAKLAFVEQLELSQTSEPLSP